MLAICMSVAFPPPPFLIPSFLSLSFPLFLFLSRSPYLPSSLHPSFSLSLPSSLLVHPSETYEQLVYTVEVMQQAILDTFLKPEANGLISPSVSPVPC